MLNYFAQRPLARVAVVAALALVIAWTLFFPGWLKLEFAYAIGFIGPAFLVAGAIGWLVHDRTIWLLTTGILVGLASLFYLHKLDVKYWNGQRWAWERPERDPYCTYSADGKVTSCGFVRINKD
jgi:hypothetical protein